jgi:hypothetical protein
MNNKWITGFVVCGLFAFAVSCGKKEEAPPAAQPEAPKTTAAEVPKAAEAKPAPAPAPAAAPAQSMVTQATDLAKGAIDKAQALMADKKYADAVTTLQSLAGQALSPENKAMVDKLIQQAQQAMAKQAVSSATDAATSQATKALGNLLGGSK